MLCGIVCLRARNTALVPRKLRLQTFLGAASVTITAEVFYQTRVPPVNTSKIGYLLPFLSETPNVEWITIILSCMQNLLQLGKEWRTLYFDNGRYRYQNWNLHFSEKKRFLFPVSLTTSIKSTLHIFFTLYGILCRYVENVLTRG